MSCLWSASLLLGTAIILPAAAKSARTFYTDARISFKRVNFLCQFILEVRRLGHRPLRTSSLCLCHRDGEPLIAPGA
jgi:hypothetical protein